MLISEALRAENAALHASNELYGVKGCQWAPYVEELVAFDGHRSVLDYGAGKGSLKASLSLRGVPIHEYDPAIPGKDADPEAADLVVCTDVLEHIEPDCFDAVLAHLAALTRKKLFFDICIRPAVKTYSDGRNAHLMVQEPAWWKEALSKRFDITYWVEREELMFLYGEAVPKGSVQPPASKRRKLAPEMSAFFDVLRVDMAKHVDGMSRVETLSVYQGVEDRDADLQVLYDLMDEADKPAEILDEAVRLAHKLLLIRCATIGDRNEEYWRSLIEPRTRVLSWRKSESQHYVVCSPKVSVGGVTVVGARPTDERWDQVQANCTRVAKRIQPAPAHARRAIVACYGPSLRQTIEYLKVEAKEPDVDVISVSGAHDFLIEHGIIPRFHVECDPRAHKADNIDVQHPQVQYLIGSCCHPVLLDKLEGSDVALWHLATPEHVTKFKHETKEPGNIVISGGGSVGVRSVSMLYTLGYRAFSIYGMDCSFADDGGSQWAGKHAGKRQDVVIANMGARKFHTSLVLLTYATDFIEMIQKVTIDCRLFGDGLLQTMVAQHARLKQ